MTIIFHRNFEKQILKLKIGERRRLQERLKIFLRNPYEDILNNHPLRGKYVDCRSINIGADLRAIYKMLDSEKCLFVEIGKHSESYG